VSACVDDHELWIEDTEVKTVLQFKAYSRKTLFTIFVLALPTVLHGESVTLEWNPNNETDLAGYRVYYGSSPRDYTDSIDTGNTTDYTVLGLEGGATYFFALTAYDHSGNESVYSDEISKTIEPGNGNDLSLITPDGGENLHIGASVDIEWVVDPQIAKIRIWLSTDSGEEWVLVKGNTNNDGHWTWAIPNFSSRNCLMKLEEYKNPSVFDVSSDCFSIAGGTTDIEDELTPLIPKTVVLGQNFPNPFNPMTTISFSIPADPGDDLSHVEVTIYDSRGRKVKKLVDDDLRSGNHSVTWNGKADRGEETPSGIYFYALSVNQRVFPPRKMVLAR